MKSVQTKTALSKILIVDDHVEARRMTRFFLRDLPFDFEECADGADALDCYRKFLPDWVLMDWEMKRMNGLTATRQIIGNFPEAKILLFTQYNDDELRAAAMEAGACGFVLKENLLMLREMFAGQIEQSDARPTSAVSAAADGKSLSTESATTNRFAEVSDAGG